MKATALSTSVLANTGKIPGLTNRGMAVPVGEEEPLRAQQDTIKPQAGFTLVEVMIVVVIVGILLAIATMNFTSWNDKYKVESYIKEIHSILMKARNDAATINSQVRVTLAANLVTTHQDTDGDGIVDAGERTTANPYPRFIIQSAINPIIFDRRGMTNNNQTIQILGYSPSAMPGVDCIVVSVTRINMGRMTGGACVQQ